MQSIAVGSEIFVENKKDDLCISANGRKTIGREDVFQLRETPVPYTADFDAEKSDIWAVNGYLWTKNEAFPEG